MANSIPLLIKVSELYYVQRMNQSEIAKEIGVSRPSVSRLLEEARERGIVKITIESPFETNNTLSQKIKEKFMLNDVTVIKSLGDYRYNMDMIGKVAAEMISEKMEEKMIIGISWGRAAEVFVEHFPEKQIKKTIALQLSGSLGSNGLKKDGNELVYRLSQKMGGVYEFFNAPAFVNSLLLQQELLKQPQIESNLSLGRKMHIAYNGIGNLQMQYNTLVSEGLLDNTDLSNFLSQGAVGSIMGRIYNLNGEEIEYVNKFPVSNNLEVLRSTPISIAAVASKERAKATLGAIRGKIINVLICDEELAEELLKIS